MSGLMDLLSKARGQVGAPSGQFQRSAPYGQGNPYQTGMTPQQQAQMVMPAQNMPSQTGMNMAQMNNVVTGLQNSTGMSAQQQASAVSMPNRDMSGSGIDPMMALQAIASIDPSVMSAPDAPPQIMNAGSNVLMATPPQQRQDNGMNGLLQMLQMMKMNGGQGGAS